MPLEADRDLTLSALIGDANGDRLVSNSDMIAVRVRRGQDVVEDNCAYDVTCDGVISNSDMIAIRVRRGNEVQ